MFRSPPMIINNLRGVHVQVVKLFASQSCLLSSIPLHAFGANVVERNGKKSFFLVYLMYGLIYTKTFAAAPVKRKKKEN